MTSPKVVRLKHLDEENEPQPSFENIIVNHKHTIEEILSPDKHPDQSGDTTPRSETSDIQGLQAKKSLSIIGTKKQMTKEFPESKTRTKDIMYNRAMTKLSLAN